jgi:membrane protease YdiL (CAAX protease family)
MSPPTSLPSRPPQPAPPGGIKGLFTRNPLVAFFALTFAFSWSIVPIGGFLPIGPLIAALVVLSIIEGRAGLADLGRRILRWRVGKRWYAFAILVPLAMVSAVLGISFALGTPVSVLDSLDPWYLLFALFLFRLINPMDGPMGEEPGWRGFALPRLQAVRSPLVATLILGVIVAAWHLPLVFLPGEDFSPVFLLGSVGITFMYTWIYNHTGGSVLMTITAHAAQGVIAFAALGFIESEETRAVAIFTAVIVLVAVGLLAYDWRFWRSQAPAECRIETSVLAQRFAAPPEPTT